MLQTTPLYVAARNGHIAVVDILVKAGADVNKVSNYSCYYSKDESTCKCNPTCAVEVLFHFAVFFLLLLHK